MYIYFTKLGINKEFRMINKVLANALASLKKIQDKEGNVFKSEKLDAQSITILKENGYLFSYS